MTTSHESSLKLEIFHFYIKHEVTNVRKYLELELSASWVGAHKNMIICFESIAHRAVWTCIGVILMSYFVRQKNGMDEFDQICEALNLRYAMIIDAAGDMRLTRAMQKRVNWSN